MAPSHPIGEAEPAPDLQALRSAARQPSSDPGARLRLAWAQLAAGALAEARETFQGASGDFPDDLDARYGLALTLKKLGDSEAAAREFQEVAQRAETLENPGRAAILSRLATGHRNQALHGRWKLKRVVWGED